jgi:hypothetical protein
VSPEKLYMLAGKPAERYTMMISENEFYIVRHAGGDQLMALSRVGDTFAECLSKIMFQATGKRVKYVEAPREKGDTIYGNSKQDRTGGGGLEIKTAQGQKAEISAAESKRGI